MRIKILIAVTIFQILLIDIKLNGQKLNFVPMDENYSQMIKFYSADTILVVIPNSYNLTKQDSSNIESFVFWGKKPHYNYKKELELNIADFEKNIQIFGPFNALTEKDLLDIPIKQHGYGFIYKNKIFDGLEDAFFYVNDSSTRLYTCANGKMNNNIFEGYGVGAYQFYIFSNNEIVFSGFTSDTANIERINLLEKEREEYFISKQTQYFELNIAKSLNYDFLFTTTEKEVDEYVERLCDFLEVDNENIGLLKVYVYANREDLQNFIAAPNWSTVYGKSVGNVNHISNFDLAILKHEAGHSIIEKKIGYCPRAFFNEGLRQATDYYFSDEAYDNDNEITIAKIDFLTEELVNGDNVKFFNNFDHYSISGVFTRYLIDKNGLAQFKEVYTQNNISKAVKSMYGKSILELINEFRSNLLTIN